MTESRSRSLGPWRSWALVVGGTIGSYAFMMPAVLARFGGLGLVSLAAAALGALFIALMFGNLSKRVTVSGGPYAYARAGFGDFGGFLIAWGYWISLWTACAAMAIGFISYAGVLIPAIGRSPGLAIGTGLALTWSVVAINVAGVRESGIVGLITTILKLLPLIAIGTVGLFFVDMDKLPPMNPGSGSPAYVFASAFALTFWAFVGIEAVTVPSEDVVSPEKTVRRALLLGMLTITAIYLLINFATMGMIPAAELAASESPLADVGRLMAGSWGSTAVSVGALISIAGAFNITVLLAGQTAMAASRDQVFPALFARLTKRNTPGAAYVIAGLLVSAMIIMSQSEGLVAGYTFVSLVSTLTAVIPYGFSALAALILDVHDCNISRGQRVREAVTAIIAFFVSMWVIASSGQESVYWVFLLLMSGIPVYVIVTRNKALNTRALAAVNETA